MKGSANILIAAVWLTCRAALVPACAEEPRFFETGIEVYSGCNRDSPKRLATMRYVTGFADGYRMADGQGRAAQTLCIPDEVDAKRLADVVCLALQRHTEIRHKPAALTVLIALTEEYPCR